MQLLVSQGVEVKTTTPEEHAARIKKETAAYAAVINAAELLVVAMIEEASALEQLAPMLAVPGVDTIHIGLKDLWQSMGMPAKAEVDKAIQQIAAAVHASGKQLSMQHAAIEDLSPQVARHQQLGVRMRSIPLLGLLLKEGSAMVQKMRVSSTYGERCY